MMYLMAIMFALVALAYYAMDPRGDRQETVEYPKAQAEISHAVFLHEAARVYLEDFNRPVVRKQPDSTACPPPTLAPCPALNYGEKYAAVPGCAGACGGVNTLWSSVSGRVELNVTPATMIPNTVQQTGFNAAAARTFLFCINMSTGALAPCNAPSDLCKTTTNQSNTSRMISRDCCGWQGAPNTVPREQETMSFVFTYVPIPFRYEERGAREFLQSAIRRYASGMTVGVVEDPSASPVPVPIPVPANNTRYTVCQGRHFVKHPFTGEPIFIPPAIVDSIGLDNLRANGQPSAVVIFENVPGGRCFPTRRAIPASRDSEACEHRVGCGLLPGVDIASDRNDCIGRYKTGI